MARRGRVAGLLVAGALVVGCGGSEDETTVATETAGETGCTAVESPVPRDVSLKAPRAKKPTAAGVEFETNCGDFSVRFAGGSPRTAASVQFLAEQRAYDSTPFHRISTELGIVQGGDPQGDGLGGPGYTIDEPPPFDLSYTRGTVAMAKSPAEPIGRAGSQFFVVYKADAGLPPEFAVLGEVSSGIETIDRIAALAEDPDGPPAIPVVIERARPFGG